MFFLISSSVLFKGCLTLLHEPSSQLNYIFTLSWALLSCPQALPNPATPPNSAGLSPSQPRSHPGLLHPLFLLIRTLFHLTLCVSVSFLPLSAQCPRYSLPSPSSFPPHQSLSFLAHIPCIYFTTYLLFGTINVCTNCEQTHTYV